MQFSQLTAAAVRHKANYAISAWRNYDTASLSGVVAYKLVLRTCLPTPAVRNAVTVFSIALNRPYAGHHRIHSCTHYPVNA